MNKSIIKSAQQHVHSLYLDDSTKNLLYHNYEHAANVVGHINEISSHYSLTDEDTIALNIAGWFHDVGHIYTIPQEHEQKSVEVVEAWLKENSTDGNLGAKVKALILSTRLDVKPEDLLQRIIKDADTYHFGTKEFKQTDKLLKKEMQQRNFTTRVSIWSQHSLELLEQHEFYTDYCKNLLGEGKGKNVAKLKKRTDDFNQDNTSTSILINDVDTKDKETVKRNSFITKGIQTMLRLTSQNHIELSSMADSKANILISVNAIIISLILSMLIRKIEVDTYLTIPTLVFLATSVITIVLAIIATRPKITAGKFDRQDVVNGKTNLLFFGNFFKTTLEEYKWGMSMMMRDPNYLYGGLVDDIYHLGVVLGRKYRLLSLAYYIFMIGILVSVLAFVLAIMMHTPEIAKAAESQGGSPF